MRTLRRPTPLLVAMTLLLGACSGPGDPASDLAREACGTLAQLADLDFTDPDAVAQAEQLSAELEAIGQRIEDSGLSDEELEAAFESECPEIFDGLTP